MVPEYKIRQELFHHLNPKPNDINLNVPVVEMNTLNLANHAADYFINHNHQILYPAKSYSVAVIYSILIEQYFDVPSKISLLDPDLLFGNDKHYQQYDRNPDVYDFVAEVLSRCNGLPYHLPQVRATADYFSQEFFLNPNPYFDNANLHK